MPCDISAPAAGDSVYLVLWYRKDSGTPIYSYDSRSDSNNNDVYDSSSLSSKADLWSEPTAFGDRAHFRDSTRPAVLSVTGVQRFDAATALGQHAAPDHPILDQLLQLRRLQGVDQGLRIIGITQQPRDI